MSGITRTPLLAEHLFGLRRRRAVRAFEHDLRFDARRVVARELVLERRRDQDVALELERRGGRLEVGRAGKVEDRFGRRRGAGTTASSSRPAAFDDRAFALGDRDDDRAAFPAELGDVVADVAESLHDHALAGEAARQAERLHVVGLIARLAQREEQPAAGRLLAGRGRRPASPACRSRRPGRRAAPGLSAW